MRPLYQYLNAWVRNVNKDNGDESRIMDGLTFHQGPVGSDQDGSSCV